MIFVQEYDMFRISEHRKKLNKELFFMKNTLIDLSGKIEQSIVDTLN